MGQLPQKYEAAVAVARPRAAAADHGVRHLPLQEVVRLPWLLLLLLWLLLLRPLLLPVLLLLLLRQFGLCRHCACLRRQLLLFRRTRRGWRKRKVLQSGQESGKESSKKVGQVQVESCWIPERNNQRRRRRRWLSFRTLWIRRLLWWLF